jgi:sugar phosphate isomerase/epimerase
MRELSIWTSYYIELTPEEMVDRLASLGWNKGELSTEHSEVLMKRANTVPGGTDAVGREFGEYARSKGINLEQGHLILWGDITHPDHREIYEKWIELYGSIGIQKAVIHPGGGYLREQGASQTEVFARQAAVLKGLAKKAGLQNLTLCIENMATHEDSAEALLALIKAAGENHLAICLDTGHLNLAEKKDQNHFIIKAGKKLKALHIADNDCSYDQHLIPFSRGTVDWRVIMTSLNKIGYEGTLNFEIPGDSIHCPLELKDEKLKFVKRTGEYLLSLTE